MRGGVMRGTGDIAVEGECYFCTATCYDTNWCSGCAYYICEVCYEIPEEDLEDLHNPEEHLREGE